MTYDNVGRMRSLPRILFGRMRLATILLSPGSAKLVRQSWIYARKQFSPSRGILDRRYMPVWASRQELDHQHATLAARCRELLGMPVPELAASEASIDYRDRYEPISFPSG
jgi:hypothetical protein